MRRHTILLVEDNESDVDLVRQFLSRGPLAPNLIVAGDGVEGLRMLRRQAPHTRVPRPDLIVLDLNLPRKDGKEVLAELKLDPELAMIPVVVLSTSSTDIDVARAYHLRPIATSPSLRIWMTSLVPSKVSKTSGCPWSVSPLILCLEVAPRPGSSL